MDRQTKRLPRSARNDRMSRREVLRGTAGAVAAFTIVPGHVLAGAAGQRPSEKLNIAAIGSGGLRIVPEAKMKAYQRPEKTIPRVPRGAGGHEQDWVRACKDGKPASSTFDYGGPLTEMVLLGVLAMRLKDTPLEWDPVHLKVTNHDKANIHVNPEFREGWTL